MDKTAFLMAANAAVWLGLCGYMAFMAVKQKGTERRLRQLEVIRDECRD